MNEKKIRKLIKIVEESHISELEVSRWGRKVRIRKLDPNSVSVITSDQQQVDEPALQVSPRDPEPQPGSESSPAESNLIQIVSPMVGTFYQAPAPNTDVFVEVNDTIKPGQTVCIIEAMKLMNEIESEAAGRVVKILVENGQPVEYNQPLFLLEPM